MSNHVTVEQNFVDCVFDQGLIVTLPGDNFHSGFRDSLLNAIPKYGRKWMGHGTWHIDPDYQQQLESVLAEHFPSPRYSVEFK